MKKLMITGAAVIVVIAGICMHTLVAVVTVAEARRILKVSLSASKADIRAAYKKSVLEEHPQNKPAAESMQAGNKLRQLKDAYDILIEAPEENPTKTKNAKDLEGTHELSEGLQTPKLDKEELARDAKLKDPTAKEIIQDIQTLIGVTGQLVSLLPADITIKNAKLSKYLGDKVKIPVKKFLYPLVNSFNNIAELILAFIRYDEELKTPMLYNAKCMYFSDEELREAARSSSRSSKNTETGLSANFTINQCVAVGCPTKGACAANFFSRGIRTFRTVLFDNLVGKYNVTTEKVEAGLLLNLLMAGTEFLNFIITFKPVQDQIAKSAWKDTAEKTPNRLKAGFDIGVMVISVLSRSLEALEIMSVVLGGKDALRTMSPELKAAGEKVLQDQREVKSFSDEDLETMAAGGTDMFGDID